MWYPDMGRGTLAQDKGLQGREHSCAVEIPPCPQEHAARPMCPQKKLPQPQTPHTCTPTICTNTPTPACVGTPHTCVQTQDMCAHTHTRAHTPLHACAHDGARSTPQPCPHTRLVPRAGGAGVGLGPSISHPQVPEQPPGRAELPPGALGSRRPGREERGEHLAPAPRRHLQRVRGEIMFIQLALHGP